MTKRFVRHPLQLGRDTLHSALGDPLLDSINFLNEVMDRYPAAISFAPGAPFAGFFDELDVFDYFERYTAYLENEKGYSAGRIRKHLYQYGPSRGQINELLANALNMDEQIQVSPDAIVVTVGCQEAIILVLRALFAKPGDVLAIVNPSFVGIAGAARILDIETQAINESGDGLDWFQLESVCHGAQMSGKRIRALYVAPDFSNPSGAVLSLAARRHLLEIAAREDFLLLEDNAYGFTAEPEAALPPLKALDQSRQVIYLGTCAKICMPGVRVGFVVADQPVICASGKTRLLADELATLKSMVTVNTSPICQAIVGGMLLEHGGSIAAMSRGKALLYRNNLSRLLRVLEREVGKHAELAGQVHWNVPTGGFFVRMRLPVPVDVALLELSAAEYGVLWTPMRFFSLNDSCDDELRLSCSYLKPEEIEEGVSRLVTFLLATCQRASSCHLLTASQHIATDTMCTHVAEV